MRIVLVTGRMGAGKTTVLKLLDKKKWPVFQADLVAKSFWKDQSPCFSKLKAILGTSLNHQSIDFFKIGKILFSNPSMLKQVENIIHPLVQKEFQKFLEEQKKLKETFVFYEMPPIQKIDKKRFSFIILVDAKKKFIIERLKQKGFLEKDIQFRLGYQIKPKELLQFADFVLYNNKGIDFLKQQLNLCLDSLQGSRA